MIYLTTKVVKEKKFFENLIKNVSDNNESLTNTIKCSNLIIREF